ncbi:MAG TPA: VWA domain-containing protein [Terriglobia bacterium]|nr:VWA domain-containing protein [Terriglobia bacterium]
MPRPHCARLQTLGLALLGAVLIAFQVLPFRLQAQKTSASGANFVGNQKSESEFTTPVRDTVHVQSSLVVAPVTVVDRSGRFVENLARIDFRVLDNGVPQRIAQFGLALEPVTAVIVVQTSRTVGPLLRQVRPLGSVFWGLLLGDYGDSAVVGFADHVRVLQDFSSGPGTLEDTLRELVARGSKSRLNDALARAVQLLNKEPATERRVIVVFSDGFDRGSKTSEADVLRSAASSNTAIYGLRFDPTQASVKRSEQAWNSGMGVPSVNFMPLVALALGVGRAVLSKNVLQQYAAFTGGVAYTHWKKQSLQDQLQQIALDINSQYVLAYVPSTLKQNGFHRIQVEVAPRGLRVRTRVGYFNGLKKNGVTREE